MVKRENLPENEKPEGPTPFSAVLRVTRRGSYRRRSPLLRAPAASQVKRPTGGKTKTVSAIEINRNGVHEASLARRAK
jgi:hypothetical protein